MRRVLAVFKPSLDIRYESSQKKFVWKDQILVFVRRSRHTGKMFNARDIADMRVKVWIMIQTFITFQGIS